MCMRSHPAQHLMHQVRGTTTQQLKCRHQARVKQCSSSEIKVTGSQTKKPRSQTTWSTDVKVVGEVNDEGLPLDSEISTRLSRVCGLAGRQKVPLTLDNFDDLSDDQKEIFNDAIQAYVQYPEELKEKAQKLSMKIISHAWRTYKSRLVKCLKEDQNPFKKFK